MEAIFNQIVAFVQNLHQLTGISMVLRLVAATLIGCAIGSERGRHGRAAGMRTHMVVCLGASLCTVLGMYIVQRLGFTADPMRVGAQVISGVGFLGAGTILVRRSSQIVGLTTAAGLWATATIGLVVGAGYFEAAFLATVLVLFANLVLPLAERGKADERPHIYLETNKTENVYELVSVLHSKYEMVHYEIVPAHSGLVNTLGIDAELQSNRMDSQNVCKELLESGLVTFAVVVF